MEGGGGGRERARGVGEVAAGAIACEGLDGDEAWLDMSTIVLFSKTRMRGPGVSIESKKGKTETCGLATLHQRASRLLKHPFLEPAAAQCKSVQFPASPVPTDFNR